MCDVTIRGTARYNVALVFLKLQSVIHFIDVEIIDSNVKSKVKYVVGGPFNARA